MSARPKAVVVGLAHAGLGLVRSLCLSNVDVVALTDGGDDDAWGRWTRFGEKVFCDLTRDGALIEELLRLGRSQTKKAALFLTSDEQVEDVSRGRERLKPYFEVNLPEQAVLTAVNNKRLFHGMALLHGLPVPGTRYVGSVRDAQEAGACIAYPCILKPSYRTRRLSLSDTPKVIKCLDAAELISGYRLFMPHNADCVVQEWVEGGDGEIYFCFAYRPFNYGETVFFTGRKIRQWPPYCGSTSVAEQCDNEEVVEATRRFIQAFDLRGYVSVEYKWHAGLKRFIIIEPTVGRANLQLALASAAGFNLPFLIYCDAVGAGLPSVRTNRPGAKWVHEPHELYSAFYYMRNEGLTFRQWMTSLKGRRSYALYRWDDPLPFMSFLYGIMRNRLKRARFFC